MISLENIEKSYNGERVLKGVSLKIERGEFLSIMGKSGSGKSTLLGILGGFIKEDSGKVYFLGEDVSQFSDDKKAKQRCSKIGFVFQNFRLIPTLNVNDNLLLPATLGKKLDNSTREYIGKLVSELQLEGCLYKYPSEISGGQAQRAAIIRALSYSPEILVLDEPTGALDSLMEERVMELLARLNRELGVTIVQVTHSEKVASYGTRIIKLNDGVIVE